MINMSVCLLCTIQCFDWEVVEFLSPDVHYIIDFGKHHKSQMKEECRPSESNDTRFIATSAARWVYLSSVQVHLLRRLTDSGPIRKENYNLVTNEMAGGPGKQVAVSNQRHHHTPSWPLTSP